MAGNAQATTPQAVLALTFVSSTVAGFRLGSGMGEAHSGS